LLAQPTRNEHSQTIFIKKYLLLLVVDDKSLITALLIVEDDIPKSTLLEEETIRHRHQAIILDDLLFSFKTLLKEGVFERMVVLRGMYWFQLGEEGRMDRDIGSLWVLVCLDSGVNQSIENVLSRL
jgi:hypothetical protein